jgi:hypothetical protein
LSALDKYLEDALISSCKQRCLWSHFYCFFGELEELEAIEERRERGIELDQIGVFHLIAFLTIEGAQSNCL